jgi:hypothetical protein
MALKRKYGVYSLMVLILGLVSCFEDKEVVYQPVRSETENIGSRDSQKRMKWAKDIRSLELGGDLVIDLLEQHNCQTNPIVVRVQSWCQTDSTKGSLVNDVYFQNQFSIPILKILSREALLSTSTSPLTCDLTLTLTESNTSSVSIYPLKSITITNSATYNSLSLFEEIKTADIYEQIKTNDLPDGDSWILACSDFQKIMRNSSEVTLEKLMGSSETNFALWRSSQQSCRLLIESREKVLLSRPIVLAFEPQPVIIEVDFHSMETVFGPVAPHPVLTLQVMNPNSYEVRFKVEKLNQSQFIFRPVYAGGINRGLLGNKHKSALKWSFEESMLQKTIEKDQWIFTLPPQQSVLLTADYTETYNCGGYAKPTPKEHPLMSPKIRTGPVMLTHPAFAGIKYGFLFGTQFLTHVADETWAVTDLSTQTFPQLKKDSTPFWDMNFPGVKKYHGVQHAAKTNKEFMNYITESYDLCKKL